jgi:hypothetical protein
MNYRLLITLEELIRALRTLRIEINMQRNSTYMLRRALEECKACQIKKPMCSDIPPPCFQV